MNSLTRSGLIVLALGLAACSTGVGGTSTPPGAQDAASVDGGGRVIFRKLDVRPDAKSPGILMNFVSDGPPEGGVPCIGCVYGATSADNIGLPGPYSDIPSNTSYWQYDIAFSDITFTGKCTLNWTIAAGKKTLTHYATTLNITSDGGFVLYGENLSRPKYSGAATYTGKAVCGKNSGSLQVPVYFQ